MDEKESRTIIETVDNDGKSLKLVLKPLGHKVLQEAQMVYNIKLTSLIKHSVSGQDGLLSRQQLEQHLDSLGVWTEQDSKSFLRLQLELRASELQLKTGGIKVSEAKKIALDMKTKRAILITLYGRRSQFDGITMESISENEKFKFLIVKCTVYAKDNTSFFVDIEDYEERQSETSSIDIATALAAKVHGYDENTEANLAENQWLKKFKLADKQGRLINDDNRLIDRDGRLIDKDGRFIDKKGKFVDDRGRPVDENGNFIIVTKPFIDDETGKPLESEVRKPRKKKKCKVV